ncbi:MAG: zf-HC2 domain-containing protein [Acidobacteriota bacterium]
MNEDEPFDSTLENYVDYLRARRGRCPAQDALIAYQSGTLEADDLTGVREHVELCADCKTILRLLESFDQHTSDQIEETGDWLEIEQRGRERFHAFLESKAEKKPAPELKPGYLSRIKSLMLRPAFAYILLLALLYPAYRGIFHKPDVVKETITETVTVEVEKPRPVIDVASLQTIKLQAVERAGGGRQSVVRLSDREAGFFLSFLVPVSERPQFVYNLEIRNAQGQVVTEKKEAGHDLLGNFRIMCDRSFFPPGRYELRVKEINKTTQSMGREFTFSFSVDHASQH